MLERISDKRLAAILDAGVGLPAKGIILAVEAQRDFSQKEHDAVVREIFERMDLIFKLPHMTIENARYLYQAFKRKRDVE